MLHGESTTISNVHLQGVRKSLCDESPLSKAQGQKNIWVVFFASLGFSGGGEGEYPPPFLFPEESLVKRPRL